MNNYLVYLHITLDSAIPFYVGKGKNNREASKHGRNRHWINIVSKHDYDIVILDKNLNHEDACIIEMYWINRIGRSDLKKGTLVNMTDGGEGRHGCIVPDNKKRFGELNPFYGKKHSLETKMKVSNSNKNRIWKDESRIKMSLSRKGKSIHSDIEKIKRKILMTGVNNPMYGKNHTEESRNKMSKSRSFKTYNTGRIILDTNTGIYYYSILEASRFKCINKSTLQAIFAGRLKNKTSLIDCTP